MAVGFGSNIPGIALPKDFQFAGGKYAPLPDDGDGNDWHDKLFNSASNRRVPGLLLFVLILVVVAFLLCGRERRTNLTNRALVMIGRDPHPSSKTPKKRKSIFPGKLFGNGTSSGPSYERVLESGNTDELELGDLPSDGYDSDVSLSPVNSLGRKGRTSGWATPQIQPGFESPAITHSSPRSKGYFDSKSTRDPSVPGLGINAASAFERGGLIDRTESRERLYVPGGLNVGMGSGSRSRQSSPTRRSPLITPYKNKVVRD